MFNRISMPVASALLTAMIGAVCACHSDEAAQQPLTVSTMSLQVSPQPATFVGTVPVSRGDERVITPRETVGAAPN